MVFASLALQAPHLLVLDEPTNHLDIESVAALVDGLKAFKGGVILVSHDARLIQGIHCQHWVVGNEGRGNGGNWRGGGGGGGGGGESGGAGHRSSKGHGGGNGSGGLRVERRGFGAYKAALVARIEKRNERIEAEAKARADDRRRDRAAKLRARLGGKRGLALANANAASTSASSSEK